MKFVNKILCPLPDLRPLGKNVKDQPQATLGLCLFLLPQSMLPLWLSLSRHRPSTQLTQAFSLAMEGQQKRVCPRGSLLIGEVGVGDLQFVLEATAETGLPF